MSSVVFWYASGWTFFVGAAFIIGAAFIPPRRFRWALPTALAGLTFGIVPSSTPAPWQFWIAASFVALYWLRSRNRESLPRAVMIMFWVAWTLAELLHHFTPAPKTAWARPVTVAVVGDSLTAGLSDTKAKNWPKTLATRPGIAAVHDFAAEGATCRTALAQAAKIPDDADVVVVAIGGNDLLGSSSLEDFKRDYDAVLAKAWQPDRLLIGLELPLPPFHNGWADAQRRIAFNHGVLLIPKWRLMKVLVDPRMTVDTIHPTQAGQDALEQLVWSTLRPAVTSQGR